MLNNILLAAIFAFPQLFSFQGNTANDNLSYIKNGFSQNIVLSESTKVATTKPPENVTNSLGVKIDARSALMVDRKSGKILFEKNSQEKMAIASITKLMTAVVALESRINLEDTVVIENDFVELEGADIDLQQAEELKVNDLFFGTLVASGNDAASALAETVSGDVDSFILQMNKKASELNMTNTHFASVSGLDTEGHYSTANDLVKLADEAFNKPKILEATSTKRYEIVPKDGTPRTYNNTDKLLTSSYPKLKAGKTGYTEDAGFCLLALSGDGQGNQIITVLLGAELNGNQFQETKALIDWAYRTYSWK